MAVLKAGLDFLVKLANRLRYCDGGRGAVRFFIRNWRGIDDVNLLAQVLGTETWRTIVRSVPLRVADWRSYMVLAPHQDDEVIGAGGLMIAARRAGCEVSVVFVTDGGQTGIHLHGRRLSVDEVRQVRREEARQVCRRLGARMMELGVDNCTMRMTAQHVAELVAALEEQRPEVVVSPWLFDGAPKHRAVNQLLYHALERAAHVPAQVWGYQVNNTPLANAHLDISADMDEKEALIRIYESQNTTLRDYAHIARGMAAWNSRFMPSKQGHEHPTYAELFSTLATEDFMALMREHLLRDLNATYCGRTSLARRMEVLRSELRDGGPKAP